MSETSLLICIMSWYFKKELGYHHNLFYSFLLLQYSVQLHYFLWLQTNFPSYALTNVFILKNWSKYFSFINLYIFFFFLRDIFEI